MAEEEKGEQPPSSVKDRIIDKRAFSIKGGINIDAFLSDDKLNSAKKPAEIGASPTDATLGALPEMSEVTEEDEAVGDIFDPFEREVGPQPGDILSDGTVYMVPETDTITEIAVEGERRLHWALMVTMIFVYSLVGWLVATALSPITATAGLIGLASLGFVLGERWIPDNGMHLLGVTWVIISMKLLYGLVIDAHHWGWIDTQSLGILLITLVGVNILLGYRHEHDAIMAQATLVSLAIASAAGSIGGELGVAVMILLATMLLHGLALHRQSGNLASLGIATSHLWVGLHAIQSKPLQIGALEILPLHDPMPLFLLTLAVTGVNGAMAARFAREENWFSKGISIIGLGRPGLWGVSVGLGMIGGFLLLASGRDTTGYALGILMTLLAVYSGSYLVVRGVEAMQVLKPLCASLPFLLATLILQETNSQVPLSGYECFAILSAIVAIGILLKHQSNVTDRVLWIGSLVLMLLLIILIPSETISEGGDEGLLLLSSFAILHLATAVLAIRRDSPSIAGVTVLAPWMWMFIHRLWTSSLHNFSQARNIDISKWDTIYLDPNYVVFYLAIATLLQYPVNLRLGDTGVNLAGKLVGASELSARLRDSGALKLWNLGLISGLAVWLMIFNTIDEIGWYAIVAFSTLAAVHVGAEAQGKHQGNPRLILILLAIVLVILQWNLGLSGIWVIILTISSLIIAYSRSKEGPNSALLSLIMSLLALQIALFALDRNISSSLIDPEPFSRTETGIVMLASGISLLVVYLPRASELEKILQPAIAAVTMLSVLIWAVSSQEIHWSQSTIAIALFVITAMFLAAQGELRSELKQVSKRELRLQSMMRKRQIAEIITTESSGREVSTQLVSTNSDLSVTDGLPELLPPMRNGIELAVNEEQTPLDLEHNSQLFHFADENLAKKAAEDPTGELARSISQAISTGNVKMADSELYSLIEKQRKRRRRSGAQGSEQMDLLIGDIHHRPVIVISFIVVTALAASWFAWFDGTLNSGLLMLVTIFALSLTWISRQRAKVQNLRMPDLMGIETPFAVTMIALGLIYLVGHFGNFSSPYAQLDLLVLSFALVSLSGISLYGRQDLAWRIPSAIEWVLLVLMMTRAFGAIFYNAVPFPLSVDPLDSGYPTIDWMLPWLFHEGVLLLLVCVWEWIEGYRRKSSMGDHRGAAGRGFFALSVVFVSTGPAGFLASIFCLRRSFDWKQPAGAAIAIHATLASLLAFRAWTESNLYQSTLEWVVLGSAIIMVAAHVYTVFMNLPKWTTAWLWNAHILLPIGILAIVGWSYWLVIGCLLLSLVTWVGGILQLRRGMRVAGAFDLALSIAIWLLIMQDDVLNSQNILVMLLALGIELGIVAWLGTRHQLQLSQD
ncbi:MAG: hypothetical protein QF440_05960 [Candidatus Thalassarchaeaceae archaeon]|nr:hypothetical protein [Candidatus Thalassarchaeaceae archaeon]